MATRPLVVCLYKAVKATPGIVAADVYVAQKNNDTWPSLTYSFRDRDDQLGTGSFDITGPDDRGDFGFMFDKTSRNDPGVKMADRLASECRTSWGYWDQVVISTEAPATRWHIDMSPYAP